VSQLSNSYSKYTKNIYLKKVYKKNPPPPTRKFIFLSISFFSFFFFTLHNVHDHFPRWKKITTKSFMGFIKYAKILMVTKWNQIYTFLRTISFLTIIVSISIAISKKKINDQKKSPQRF